MGLFGKRKENKQAPEGKIPEGKIVRSALMKRARELI